MRHDAVPRTLEPGDSLRLAALLDPRDRERTSRVSFRLRHPESGWSQELRLRYLERERATLLVRAEEVEKLPLGKLEWQLVAHTIRGRVIFGSGSIERRP